MSFKTGAAGAPVGFCTGLTTGAIAFVGFGMTPSYGGTKALRLKARLL